MKPPFSLDTVPTKTRCYIYKDITGEIIYIGKAKNLRKRVSSYFSKEHADDKTTLLVQNIASMDTIITKNEVEALLLESQLIRKHVPKFNIDLKYGMRYAWILLTDEKYPRLITARHKKGAGEYFGPFVSGGLRRQLIDILRKRFFIRTCRVLPKRECLRYHMELCKAPCIKKQTQGEYIENIEKIKSYLRGDNKQLIKELKEELKEFSHNTQFEKAQERKEQIEALEYLQGRMIVENERTGEEDVITYYKYTDDKDYQEKVKFVVLSFRRGTLQNKDEFNVADEENVLDNFVKRYYDSLSAPNTLILPHNLDDAAITDRLKEQTGRAVNVLVPMRGLKKDLLELAEENLKGSLTAEERLAGEFKELMGLDKEVHTIECFDISHLAGTDTVAAMVYFRGGKPLKSQYRKFKIKTVTGIDDFRSMYEVVKRRYTRLKEEKKPFPDLIVIDGGEQQLAFAHQALEELGISDELQIIGLAKKFEEIYRIGEKQPLRLDKKSDVMRTIMQARDEAHRFSITYQRSLRSKKIKNAK